MHGMVVRCVREVQTFKCVQPAGCFSWCRSPKRVSRSLRRLVAMDKEHDYNSPWYSLSREDVSTAKLRAKLVNDLFVPFGLPRNVTIV